MAIAYKCDRCGKLYEVNIITHENEQRFIVGKKKKKCENIGVRYLDLCGDCQSDIEKVLMKKTPLFTADEVFEIVCKHGQSDKQFNLGETIKYSPSEIYRILGGKYEDG